MKKWLVIISILILVLLSACNGTDDENSGTNDKGNTSGKQERTFIIEDSMGKQTIEGTPKKIVVLEWFFAEHLLALGMQPAGVPNIDGYNDWINIERDLSDRVKDVGTRQEPNLEAISRLDPDLIIAAKFRHEKILGQLKKIAPTVTFAPYSEKGSQNLYKEMLREFKMVAKIVDKKEKAKKEIAKLNQFYDKQKQIVEESGLKGTEYISALAFTTQNAPVLRLYAENSIVSQVMKRLGFENMYESEKTEPYGFTQTGVEALQKFQEENPHFLYIVQKDDNIFENQLKGNPVWEQLSFVKSGKIHQIPGDTPVFGGVLSAKVLAEELVNSMINK
ncbi:ABC transporter substrate-binding protein [Virgibacillus ihumii]|uniref:ABC transporter substrate-binding protein n=1 Tax=Virgibacillus ihumii TaxID=2686091 RepID=UPI00157C4E48|nr:iron-siderophore ABC transporter substrate-binding protein [Virgibacillus ihumii]